MKTFVYDDEIERVKKSLEAAPTISQAFGKDWINNNLLNKEERSKKHAMFWMVLDEKRCKKMEDWLLTLKTKLQDAKFTKVVNLIKEKKQEIEFYSFVAEIEVLSYYKRNENDNYKVEFEPHIPKTTKVGDIEITFDSTQVFLEITRLFSSEEEEKIDKIKELYVRVLMK
jgi:ribosomal protein L30E